MTDHEYRVLDRKIAERILGWERIESDVGTMDYVGYDPKREGRYWLCHFSTRISDAWKVVEAMRDKAFSVRKRFADALAEQMITADGHMQWPYALLHLEPEHICRAALQAVRTEETEEA